MQKFSIDRLTPGVKLAKDIYSYSGQLLLSRGTILEDAHLAGFKRQGLMFVYVLEDKQEGAGKAFDEVYHDSLSTVKSFMVEAKLGHPLEEEEVKETVDLLLGQVFDEVDIFKQLRMMKDKDNYLFTHSVNVSLLSILIARWLKYPENVIKDVGVAGLLHDMGKLFVPSEILAKPGKLTPEEFEQIKQHAMLGYNIVAQMDWISPAISEAVLLHHERMDGSGYPTGAQGDGISLYARIIAVADIYDAITSDRIYSTKEPPYRAAEVLWEDSFGKLDPNIAKVFYDRVSNFYVGNLVKLSNGQVGKVVYINPSLPTRPVVQVGEKFHDLCKDRNIVIVEIVDE